MTSRYGLWIVCVSAIGLAGCANWQNRSGSTGPGIAANFQPGSAAGPAVVAPATGVAPGTTFNEPPPPVPPPPSDPGAMLAPLGSAPAQKLDLSAAPEPGNSPAPSRMYNLGGGPKPAVSSSPEPSKRAGSSTLSKLATKAGTSGKSSSSPSQSSLSTVQRLQKASASSDDDGADSSALPTPQKTATAREVVEPAPKVKQNAEPAAPMVDTALLAQPVRKGAGSDDKKDSDSSKGPQSSVAPAKKPFENNKALIYPVSSPASDRPVDITQFS